jgi:hypothetical protein
MTALVRRTDPPGAVALTPTDDVDRSVVVLEAGGWTVVRPLTPVRGTWHLLATLPATPIALLLVAVLRERPPQVPGVVYGPPPGWSPWTQRHLHVWTGDESLPETITL